MTTKSRIRCNTPRCMAAIEKYGEHYHSVYDKDPHMAPDFCTNAIARCERCGGWTPDGRTFIHKCADCHTDVEPGELVGLFVPHLCTICEQKVTDDNISRHRVCSLCRKPYNRCCC